MIPAGGRSPRWSPHKTLRSSGSIGRPTRSRRVRVDPSHCSGSLTGRSRGAHSESRCSLAASQSAPSISVNILPGNITTMGLGKKALKGRNGEITVHDAHVKVDGCAGPVVMRFFAYAGISTDNGDDSVNTYGDILTL